MEIAQAAMLVQLFFSVVIGLYFLNLYRSQRATKQTIDRDSGKEMGKLALLRGASLSEPLSEKTRPKVFADIVGQEEGIRALKAALCSPNPQHVLIYGPPGVGKTCAARLVLEEAKKTPGSPFPADAKFIEMDATCIRFDERAIADPLIGSVHDPIYQGAGAMGVAGIPQPKAGAVTKAHCGVLFLDEIGEIHPIQMNKLLKVLEDRKVLFESAYYSAEDANIPRHIHDIFQNGLPADFRLVGATTRNPSDIPPAIRSRCLEIFFRPLKAPELEQIAFGAAKRGGFALDLAATQMVGRYSDNGREAVNIVQMAGGVAYGEGRKQIAKHDVEWVAETCRYRPRLERRVPKIPCVGVANGLAVGGGGIGALLEIEVIATPNPGKGAFTVTGMVDEEEIGGGERRMRRKSTARASAENVLSVLRSTLNKDPKDYDIHLNLPGGIPVDGPSAGIAIAVAMASALKNQPADPRLALTGEISIRGQVRPVGGVRAKIEAAAAAGASRVLIPRENYMDNLRQLGVEVIPVSTIEEVLLIAFEGNAMNMMDQGVLSADSN